jgi:hypothetical protein
MKLALFLIVMSAAIALFAYLEAREGFDAARAKRQAITADAERQVELSEMPGAAGKEL